MMTISLAMAAEDSFMDILCRTKSKHAASIRVLFGFESFAGQQRRGDFAVTCLTSGHMEANHAQHSSLTPSAHILVAYRFANDIGCLYRTSPCRVI
jgi:hypothetical protein